MNINREQLDNAIIPGVIAEIGSDYDINAKDVIPSGYDYDQRYSLQNHLFIFQNVAPKPINVSRGTLQGRAEVKEFSQSSGARMRKYLRTTVAEYVYFVTLTYPHNYERDGRQSKEHLRRFIQELKREQARNGFNMDKWGCFWFMEFQARGAIHYHLFITDPVGFKWLSQKWYDICGTEDKRHLAAGTNVEKLRSGRHGTCAYAAKYAAKSEQKIIPDDIKNAGRFWGVSGLRRCMEADTRISLEYKGVPRIERARNNLKWQLLDLIDSGDAHVVKQTAYVWVVYLESMAAQNEILRLMRRLQMANAFYSYIPPILMPEDEVQLDFQGEDVDYAISLL